jgi:hypothetical protein
LLFFSTLALTLIAWYTKQVKNIARLALLFSLCFVTVFLVYGSLQVLTIYLESARTTADLPGLSFSAVVAIFQSAVPVALYLSLLFGLGYAGMRHISAFGAVPCLFILSIAATTGLSLGLVALKDAPVPLILAGHSVSITAGSIFKDGTTTIVVLKSPSGGAVPYTLSSPGQPIEHREEEITLTLPFNDRNTTSITTSFSVTQHQLESRLQYGLISFEAYLGALVLVLLSLYGLFRISTWPAANVFLGTGAFVGFLIFETVPGRFVPETVLSFLTNRVPEPFIMPILIVSLIVPVIIGTIVIYTFKSRKVSV